MTATSSITSAAARTGSIVTEAPRRRLRLEAAVLLAGSLIAFSAAGQPWRLVPATILVPDLFAAGYLSGTRLGAHLHNLAHGAVLPAALTGAGWWKGRPLVLALDLVSRPARRSTARSRPVMTGRPGVTVLVGYSRRVIMQ